MAVVTAVIGAVFAAFGILGGVAPGRLLALVHAKRAVLLPIAVASRILIGVLLVLAAPHCRWPAFVLAIGVAAFVTAVVLLVMGRSGFERFVESWLDRPPGLARLISIVAIALGGILMWCGGWLA